MFTMGKKDLLYMKKDEFDNKGKILFVTRLKTKYQVFSQWNDSQSHQISHWWMTRQKLSLVMKIPLLKRQPYCCLKEVRIPMQPFPIGQGGLLHRGSCILIFKIEYHAVGDTWWQPLLSYGKWCTELKIGSFIY